MNEGGDRIRVLHVDDEPGLRDIVASFLEREDDRITVQTAPAPQDGREILDDHEVDCIVSDYDMPRTNGIEFLRTVREAYPDLPFILYTGKGTEDVAAEAVSAGATDYLQKESSTEQYTVLANRVVNAVERYRSQQEAEHTRKQLQAISENSTDAIVIIDSDSRIRFANPAFEVLFGRLPEDLQGESVTTIMPDRYQDDHLEGIDRYLETGEKSLEWSNIEFTGRHADGSEIPLSISFSEFEQNGDRRFIGILRDISERTRMEAELREREERFRQLAENIREVVWMSDPEKEELIYVNPAYEEIWGESTDSLYDDPTAFLEAVHPEDRERVEAAIEGQASGGYDEEYRIIRPDGEQRWVRDRAVPVENDAGEVFRVVGVTSDITDRKEREREYEVTIEFLQELYDVATTTGIDIHEKITRLLRVGPERLGLPYGYLTRIEVDHEDPTEGTQRVIEASGDHELLQPGNACPIAQSYCRKTIQTEGLAEVHNAVQAGWEDDPAYELFNLGCYIGSAIRVDGDLYGTVFFASETPRDEPFTDAERTFVRLMSQLVSYELERDRVTRELQSQNERLSEFTSIVSHDLRNPLSVAKGRLDLLAEDCESDHIEVIERAHGRMETLITDLLTLARKGQAALEVTVVELVAAARKSWQNVDTGNATLVVDTDRTVRADEGQLRHLFENLFSNSVGHGGSGVTVTVGGLADGFYVADDGQGIPPKNRDDVFEPGYSTSERGTGFGLRIVERVADGHGWTIQLVESETGGARFNITGVEEPAD